MCGSQPCLVPSRFSSKLTSTHAAGPSSGPVPEAAAWVGSSVPSSRASNLFVPRQIRSEMAGLCVRGGSAWHWSGRQAHFAFPLFSEQKRVWQPLGPGRGLSEAQPQEAAFGGQRGKMGPRALCLGTEKGNNLLGPALAWPGRGTWILKTGGFGEWLCSP